MIGSYGVDDLMSKIGSLKITIEFVFFCLLYNFLDMIWKRVGNYVYYIF